MSNFNVTPKTELAAQVLIAELLSNMTIAIRTLANKLDSIDASIKYLSSRIPR